MPELSRAKASLTVPYAPQALGTVMDVTMDIVSSLAEVYAADKKMSRRGDGL